MIRVLISALYKLFVCFLNFLSYFFSFLMLTFLLVYFAAYLSTSRIDPFRFHSGGRTM